MFTDLFSQEGGGDVGKLVLNNNEMADLSHRYILILKQHPKVQTHVARFSIYVNSCLTFVLRSAL